MTQDDDRAHNEKKICLVNKYTKLVFLMVVNSRPPIKDPLLLVRLFLLHT